MVNESNLRLKLEGDPALLGLCRALIRLGRTQGTPSAAPEGKRQRDAGQQAGGAGLFQATNATGELEVRDSRRTRLTNSRALKCERCGGPTALRVGLKANQQ